MHAARWGLILISLGCALLCARLFVEERGGAGVAAAAASLREDPARWRRESATLQRFLEATAVQPACQGQRDRDMLTLALAQVDLAGKAVGTAIWQTSLERARAEARHLLACSPTDGRAWLDYAVLTARLEGNAAAAYPGVLLSSWFAPHDAAPLKARIRYATWLAGQSVGGAVPLLDADLVVFLNSASLRDVRAMLADAGPALRPFLRDIPIAGDDPARLSLVNDARGG
jgi:hypothetical protein